MQNSATAHHELGTTRGGYAGLAAFVAVDPDNETFVYRKFRTLMARNLLFVQSQIIELEARLTRLDDEDRKSQDTELRLSAMRWESFAENANQATRPEKERMDLHLQIKEKLREYSTQP